MIWEIIDVWDAMILTFYDFGFINMKNIQHDMKNSQNDMGNLQNDIENLQNKF